MRIPFLAPLIGFALAAPAGAATLTVDLDGVRGGPGKLYVSVQTREQFMQDNGVAGSVVVAPQGGSQRFSYEVPPGDYAVSIWHDDNGNGVFDKDAQFKPLDGWAMPNGRQLRGEPTFDQIKTVVGNAPTAVHLVMTYGR